LRKLHPEQRPIAQDEAVIQFKARIEDIIRRSPLDHVLNIDETSWKLMDDGFLTVAERRSERRATPRCVEAVGRGEMAFSREQNGWTSGMRIKNFRSKDADTVKTS
jgi:hypothetical protein